MGAECAILAYLAKQVATTLAVRVTLDAFHRLPRLEVACMHLQAGLPPGELRRAVFPLLSSYSSPEAQAFPQHSLSEAALTTR